MFFFIFIFFYPEQTALCWRGEEGRHILDEDAAKSDNMFYILHHNNCLVIQSDESS